MEGTTTLQKKHQVIPKLRFKIFERSWANITIGDYTLSSAFGPRFSSDLYSESGNVVTLRTTDMDDEGNINYDKAPLASLNIDEFREHLLIKDDLVISRSGTIGVTGIFQGYSAPVIPGAFLIRFRFKTDKLSTQFIRLFFNSQKGRNQIVALSAGGVQKNLTGSSVLKMVVPVPEFAEQQKIASFLSAIDEKIQQLTRKREILEQYKKGVMQQLFSGKLRFKDENGKAYPKWEEKSLNDIAEISTGSSNRQDSGLDGEFTFFDRSQDIRTSSIYLFDGEAVIVAGEGQEFIPKYFVGKFDLHQRTYAIMNYKNAVGKYLFYYVYYHRSYFFSQAVGSTVKSLRLPMFQKMRIKLPNVEEQQKIASYLSSLDTKIESVATQITQSQTFKKGLLQQMFV